jgi:hypothetical protein
MWIYVACTARLKWFKTRPQCRIYYFWEKKEGSIWCLVSRDEVGRKRSKICITISYHIFLLGNDTKMIRSKMILMTKNWYIRNETIILKICRYRSITVPQIENTKTMNRHICNMFTTKWVTNNPTWILLCHVPILVTHNYLIMQPTSLCHSSQPAD